MGVLGSGRLAKTTSTYSSCSLSRDAFSPRRTGGVSTACASRPPWAWLRGKRRGQAPVTWSFRAGEGLEEMPRHQVHLKGSGHPGYSGGCQENHMPRDPMDTRPLGPSQDLVVCSVVTGKPGMTSHERQHKRLGYLTHTSH